MSERYEIRRRALRRAAVSFLVLVVLSSLWSLGWQLVLLLAVLSGLVTYVGFAVGHPDASSST